MLHTVNKSPFATNSLQTCLGLARSGSAILLIEDGVYGALAGTAAAEAVVQALLDSTNRFSAITDGGGELTGFCCLGANAQVSGDANNNQAAPAFGGGSGEAGSGQ